MKNKKRVTLVWSLYKPLIGQETLPSLSIAYLAKTLERAGIETSCVDANLLVYDKWGYKGVSQDNKDEILKKIIQAVEATDPEILGIGFWTEGVSFAKEFVKAIKARNPGLKVIAGGPSASFMPEKIFAFIPEIDFIAKGEGEQTLLELAGRIFAGRSTKNILGISYKTEKGVVRHNKARPIIRNLDSLPLIDYENFTYIGKHGGLNLLSSRGCPFNCHYCSDSNFYGAYRMYSPAYIVRQIKHLKKLYDIRYIAFADDNVVVDPVRTIKLFSYLAKQKFDCEFPISARSDCLNEELFKIFHLAKIPWISIGVENIVPRILKFYNRTRQAEKYLINVRRVVKWLDKYKIGASFSFVLGAPIETEEEIDENIIFARTLHKQNFVIYASILRLVPGSFFWHKYRQGEMKIFSEHANDGGFAFDKPYLDIPWVCPGNFSFKHDFYSNEEYLRIKNKTMLEISKLYVNPADLPRRV